MDYTTHSAPHEYVIKVKTNAAVIAKRVLLILLYAAWMAAGVLAGIATKSEVVLICLFALLLIPLIRFTWRLSRVEFDYSVFDGVLTISKIYGGSVRRRFLELPLRDLAAVYPYDGEDAEAKTAAFHASKALFAASGADAPNLWAALWEDPDTREHKLLYFEPDETTLRLIRQVNFSALSRAPR